MDTLCFEADYAIPVPKRQRTFYMEIKIDSDNPQLAFGLCGTVRHNNLQDATGYGIDSGAYNSESRVLPKLDVIGVELELGGFFRIQGKTYPTALTFERGATFGVLFNWKGKEIIFTKDDKIGTQSPLETNACLHV